MRKYMRGVSLLELMIVVLIVGILAAIAYPNYREYVVRAKRTEAQAALLQIATKQESVYLQTNTYTQDLTALGFATTPVFMTDSESYNVSVGLASANDFTATATYLKGGDEATRCLTFQIDGRGAKTSAPDTNCWTRTR